jgi:hypothetical protein
VGVPLLLLAGQPAAARIDFKVAHGDRALAGAEICFFAVSRQEPALMNQLFHGEDVECLPADQVLEIPPGNWFYFARHAAGFVTDLRLQVSIAPNAPEEAYKTVHEEVVPAGTVRVDGLLKTLANDERLALLVGTAGTGTMVFPLVKGETAFLVPADTTCVVAIIKDHRPTRISPVMRVAARQTIEVGPWPEPSPLVHDVVAAISFPAFFYNILDETADRLEPPDAALEVNGQRFPPTFALHTRAIGETLLLFKDVPRSAGEIRLGGRFWMPDSIRADGRARVGVLEDPMTTEPAGAIRATITLPPEHSPLACDTPVAIPSVSVLSCPADAPTQCTVLRTAEVGGNGEVEIGGLRAGDYALSFDAALGSAPVRSAFRVETGTVTSVAIDPSYYSFYGTVFLGDRPVARALSFFGRGKAVSAPDGHYAMTLAGAAAGPAASVVRVTDCAAETATPYMHVTESAPKRGERFDIVIPDNSVHVKLLGAPSHEKIDGSVNLISYQGDSADVLFFARLYPAMGGETTIAHIVTSTEIALCGAAEGYETHCLPRFRMGGSENRNVEIELTRAIRWEGRIALPSAVEYGQLWFVDDHGTLTEWSAVDSDGKFKYKMPHTARDYVVLTGSLPLAVMPWPTAVTGATVNLSYPAGRSRDLTVRRTGSRAADSLVGLTIGESVIPTEAFAYHQGLRGAHYMIAPGQPLPISDILESAPIAVILGPELNAEQFPADADWLSLIPYVRSRPRMALSPSGAVTFDE